MNEHVHIDPKHGSAPVQARVIRTEEAGPRRAPAAGMREAFFALGGTFAVQVMVSMAVVTVPVLAPTAAAAMSVSPTLVGIFVAIVYAAGMAASVFSGALIHRFGPIRVSQVCLVLCALALACVASGIPMLLGVGAVLLGFGYGPITPASSHVLAKTTPARLMAFVFSLKQTGVPLGGALAGAIVPTLALAVGWQPAALWVGAACLLVTGFTQPVRQLFDAERDPIARVSASGLAAPLRDTLRNPPLRLLAVSSFFFGALQLCLVTYLVTYLVSDVGVSLVRAGLMLSAAQAAGVVARLVFGALADRSSPPTVVLGWVAMGMGVGAAAAGTMSPGWHIGWIALVCAAFGATATGWNGVYLAQVARLAKPGAAGAATGAALAVTYGGVLVGPPAFAFMTQSGVSYATAFIVVALPAILCGVLLLRAHSPA